MQPEHENLFFNTLCYSFVIILKEVYTAKYEFPALTRIITHSSYFLEIAMFQKLSNEHITKLHHQQQNANMYYYFLGQIIHFAPSALN